MGNWLLGVYYIMEDQRVLITHFGVTVVTIAVTVPKAVWQNVTKVTRYLPKANAAARFHANELLYREVLSSILGKDSSVGEKTWQGEGSLPQKGKQSMNDQGAPTSGAMLRPVDLTTVNEEPIASDNQADGRADEEMLDIDDASSGEDEWKEPKRGKAQQNKEEGRWYGRSGGRRSGIRGVKP